MPEQTRINILGYPGDRRACGYMRLIYPLGELNRIVSQNVVVTANCSYQMIFDIRYFEQCSMLILQRCSTEGYLKYIEWFKKEVAPRTGTALYIDVDDLLTDVPEYNFAYNYFQNAKPILEQCWSMADRLLVSTEYLGHRIMPGTLKTVVRNRFPRWLWPKPVPRVQERARLRIVLAGSDNHYGQPSHGSMDLGDMCQELLDYILVTKDRHEWIFFGGVPDCLRPIEQITKCSWVHILDFPAQLLELQADILVAPLANNEFNNCKSALQVLNAVCAGIPAVVPLMPPYVGYPRACQDAPGMIQMIETLCDPAERLACWRESYVAYADELFWTDEALIDLINSLCQPACE